MTDEARLINANALKEKLINIANIMAKQDFMAYAGAMVEAAKMAERQPTIDAKPVRYGKWMHCNGKSNLWYCSECGEKVMYNPTRHIYNIRKKAVNEVNAFCRACGAKMDGEIGNAKK